MFGLRSLLLLFVMVALLACTVEGEEYNLQNQQVSVTFFHTSDIHAKMFPWKGYLNIFDRSDGLSPVHEPFGGIARLATVLKEQRRDAKRSFYVDSGDVFQGAVDFNYFKGEVEMRAFSALGINAMAFGNHEIDMGGENLAYQVKTWANFPFLAANYIFEPPELGYAKTLLAEVVKPYTILYEKGLTVGVIGMGSVDSILSVKYQGNNLGMSVTDTYETLKTYINFLEQHVDIIILLSHLGVTDDQKVAEHVGGIDIIFGGHNHITLDPPQWISYMGDGTTPLENDPYYKAGHRTMIVHSGTNAKFLNRVDLLVENKDIIDYRYTLFPIDARVAEDGPMRTLLEPYELELKELLDLNRVIGHATAMFQRNADDGEDSPLGNLVARSMMERKFVETNFALTNSTGIRADLNAGDITEEQTYQILPFENYITTMFLTGEEILELFDYVAYRSATRGCNAQAQIAGIEVTLYCRGTDEEQCARVNSAAPCSYADPEQIFIGGVQLNRKGVYEMATNDYISRGGSGYEVLERNTTRTDTGISIRSAVTNYIEKHSPISPEDFEDNSIHLVR
jgi:5'-nucleotidase